MPIIPGSNTARSFARDPRNALFPGSDTFYSVDQDKQYVTQDGVKIFSISLDPAELAAYQAAGWRLPTDTEIAAWALADPYHGTQGVPRARPLKPVV